MPRQSPDSLRRAAWRFALLGAIVTLLGAALSISHYLRSGPTGTSVFARLGAFLIIVAAFVGLVRGAVWVSERGLRKLRHQSPNAYVHSVVMESGIPRVVAIDGETLVMYSSFRATAIGMRPLDEVESVEVEQVQVTKGNGRKTAASGVVLRFKDGRPPLRFAFVNRWGIPIKKPNVASECKRAIVNT